MLAGRFLALRAAIDDQTIGSQPVCHKPVELLAKIEFTADFFPLFALNSRKTVDLYLTARVRARR